MPIWRNLMPIIAIFLMVGLSMPISADSRGRIEIPDSPAGEKLELFIKTLNSGEKSSFSEFIRKHFYKNDDTPEAFDRRLQFTIRLYEETGGLDLHSILESERLSISALAQSHRNTDMEWIKVSVVLQGEPPFNVDYISIEPGDDPNYPIPEGNISEEELRDWLDNFISRKADEGKFSGAVLVAKDDRIVFEKAAGLASRRFNVQNNINTKFNLGSANKMFTGIAIGQLAENGKISIDDPIIKYLPDYPNPAFARKATIHHLLTHTSGLGSYWPEIFENDWRKIKTVEQVYDIIVDDSVLFEPGERMSYSNSGPIILGMIIEKVSRMDYYEYIRQNIYKPAGMKNTDCYEMDYPIPNLAIGYTKMGGRSAPENERIRNNLYMHFIKGGPAGGGFSTVRDMHRFAQALNNNKLLSSKYTQLVTGGKVAMGPDMKYGYLFSEARVNGQRAIGHNGGGPGINAFFKTLPENGWTIVVLANMDPPVADLIGEKILELIAR